MSAPEKLALYFFHGCPYCRMVMNVIEQLDVEVELRDTRAEPQHQQDLLAARGRGTVPVLRIARAGQDDVWMPESADIAAYLQQQYG
ncbi:glutaredoxin family protein [Motilimonas pumila]|uniref:Glutaredoxin n=1 Tax=Motilimonas pumila TaxID=2303987 RepID=A0A418YDL9_9GAMM|nr:glutathione S-transferase N-terminal domain-containing protein [Motilimonas pumila]RJG42617.1 glutaredoxin [Motilimonas pumila]